MKFSPKQKCLTNNQLSNSAKNWELYENSVHAKSNLKYPLSYSGF